MTTQIRLPMLREPSGDSIRVAIQRQETGYRSRSKKRLIVLQINIGVAKLRSDHFRRMDFLEGGNEGWSLAPLADAQRRSEPHRSNEDTQERRAQFCRHADNQRYGRPLPIYPAKMQSRCGHVEKGKKKPPKSECKTFFFPPGESTKQR